MNEARPESAREWAIVAFLGLGMAAVYLLGRRLAGGAEGVVAAVLFGCAPFVVFSSLRLQLDLPLATMVVADRVTLGGVAVPSMLVDWVVRTWDPRRRIASRLPIPVTVGRIDITPEAIRISAKP